MPHASAQAFARSKNAGYFVLALFLFLLYIPSTLARCSARSHEATDQRAGRGSGAGDQASGPELRWSNSLEAGGALGGASSSPRPLRNRTGLLRARRPEKAGSARRISCSRFVLALLAAAWVVEAGTFEL